MLFVYVETTRGDFRKSTGTITLASFWVSEVWQSRTHVLLLYVLRRTIKRWNNNTLTYAKNNDTVTVDALRTFRIYGFLPLEKCFPSTAMKTQFWFERSSEEAIKQELQSPAFSWAASIRHDCNLQSGRINPLKAATTRPQTSAKLGVLYEPPATDSQKKADSSALWQCWRNMGRQVLGRCRHEDSFSCSCLGMFWPIALPLEPVGRTRRKKRNPSPVTRPTSLVSFLRVPLLVVSILISLLPHRRLQ